MYYSFALPGGGMYYSPMAQPKTPPISIRPSAALLAEVDAWARARGLKRHAALLALIDFGLGTPARPAQRREAPKVEAAVKSVAVSVPLAGTFERKPYQKRQKP